MKMFVAQVITAVVGAIAITLGGFVFHNTILTIVGALLYCIGMFSMVYYKGYRKVRK